LLNKKDPSPLLPKSDEEEGNTDRKEAKDSTKTATSIDLEGIGQRILAVNIPLRNYTSLVAAPKDYIFYTENVPNQQGVTLHRYNFKDKKSEVFLTPITTATERAVQEALRLMPTQGVELKKEPAAPVKSKRPN
jgi:tricorn protease